MRLNRAVLFEMASIRSKLTFLENILKQKEEDCKEGRHLMRSEATGGRRGEMRHYCAICEYTTYGYD